MQQLAVLLLVQLAVTATHGFIVPAAFSSEFYYDAVRARGHPPMERWG